MNDRPKIPDAEARAHSIANWRETIRKIDALNSTLDELIAMVEAENLRSPLTLYRLNKLNRTESLEQTTN